MMETRALPFRRTISTGLLALALGAASLASTQAEATPYLKLTGPAKGATLLPLATNVTFTYAIDVPGFRNHTHSTDPIATWITVCTGACTASADIIDSHQLTPSEQASFTLPISKIRQHLTDHNLPIGTRIKWNLMFHVAGIFYDPNDRQTNSDFTLGHVSAAGGVHLEAKPTATAPLKPH